MNLRLTKPLRSYLSQHRVGKRFALISMLDSESGVAPIGREFDFAIGFAYCDSGEFDVDGYHTRGVGRAYDPRRVRQYQSLALSIAIYRWSAAISIRGRRIR